MLDRLKTLLGGSSAGTRSATGSLIARKALAGDPFVRQSNGLDQFFTALRDRSALNILDFAGATQANVSYITSMGHRISSEDFMRSLEATFGDENFFENRHPQLVDHFCRRR